MNLDLRIEVICEVCGETLEAETTSRYGENQIEVSPCPKCLAQAEDDGYYKKEQKNES